MSLSWRKRKTESPYSPICSFQFETETEGTKLRRDVMAEGSTSSGGSTTGIISLLSGQEEMFAFQRAVSFVYCCSISRLQISWSDTII